MSLATFRPQQADHAGLFDDISNTMDNSDASERMHHPGIHGWDEIHISILWPRGVACPFVLRRHQHQDGPTPTAAAANNNPISNAHANVANRIIHHSSQVAVAVERGLAVDEADSSCELAMVCLRSSLSSRAQPFASVSQQLDLGCMATTLLSGQRLGDIKIKRHMEYIHSSDLRYASPLYPCTRVAHPRLRMSSVLKRKLNLIMLFSPRLARHTNKSLHGSDFAVRHYAFFTLE